MRICIIGINFYPELTGCAPYTTDLARCLQELGHEIYVVTGFPHYPEWKIRKDNQFQGSKSEFYEELKVLRFSHYVPKNPTLAKRVLYEITFFLNAILHMRKIKADLTVAVSPNLLSMLLARIFKKKGSISKVLVQDIFSSALKQTGTSKSNILFSVLYIIESKLFRGVDSIGIVSDKFLWPLLQMGVAKNKITHTPNYSISKSPIESTDNKRTFHEWVGSSKIVMYTGNLGKKQDLFNLIDAFQLIARTDENIKLLIVGDGSQKNNLMKKAENMSSVAFLDLVPEEDYLHLLNSADILVAHESDKNEEMSISSKVNSYLLSVKTILIVCSEKSPTFQEVSKYGLEWCEAGQPEKLAIKLIEICAGNHLRLFKYADNQDLRTNRIEWVLKNE